MVIFKIVWYNSKSMDFIKISKKHSFWGDIAHIFLNIILAVIVWLSIYVTKTPWIAILLVFVSKWRTFAVRPRFWLANIKSNLVDLLFSLSIVILMFSTGVDYIFSQGFLLALYIFWLTIIKPNSNDLFIRIQALFTVFFGFSALYSITYGWGEVSVFILAFLLGYSTVRHIISSRVDSNIEVISIFWGLNVAEFAWIFNFLVIGYRILLAPYFNFVIPQAAIILTVLSFVAFDVLDSGEEKKKDIKELLPEIIFATILILTLLIFFSTIPVAKS